MWTRLGAECVSENGNVEPDTRTAENHVVGLEDIVVRRDSVGFEACVCTGDFV